MCYGNSVTKPAPATVAVFGFKPGDLVRVLHSVPTHSQGWKNSWATEMNNAIGKTGTVKSVLPDHKDVTVDIPGVNGTYGYPSFALELVNPPAVSTAIVKAVDSQTVAAYKPIKTFEVGQRVRVNYTAGSRWNGEGVVVNTSPSNVIVRMSEGFFKGSNGGFLPSNLTVLDSPAPTPAPVQVPVSSQAFAIAKQLAVTLAKANTYRRVTIDQVQAELSKLGFSSTDLGNAAGVIFKGGQFRNTGYTSNSGRTGNRGRRVIVWEYTGPTATPSATPVPTFPAKSFIVETSHDNGKTFRRSQNSTVNGEPLDVHVFATFEEADREAQRQHRMATYRPYRATAL